MSALSKQVAFIIGYGPGVGSAVARKFREKGFNIAVAHRKATSDDESYLNIKLDMARPEEVGHAFSLVESKYGPASVVVFNVSAFAAAPGGRSDPLSLDFKDFAYGTSVGGVNAFQVAKFANFGFDKLGPEAGLKTFVATGNVMPWRSASFPDILGLSSGKKVLANIVEACAGAYGPLGKRFYYASEVTPKGGPVRKPDPDTHASVYHRLHQQDGQGPWDVRFTKGGEFKQN
ncbi:hypothetical protein FRB99_003224 [Tulasnella sp. 403]|nr:hypothetical protein FRB99_003224 [Tulasnella sp. 403]